ncbi:MAG: DUF177 domain-containing protein [Clostridia bacterium]|jgi:uncharacterized protein|nr:DUF177 domain-containing protein [Clostridia bacterium]
MSNENKNLLDLNPIFKGETKNIDFSFSFTPENLDSDIVFSSPVKVTGRVFEKASGSTRTESLVMAEISLSGEYKTNCARCLDELCVPVDFSDEYSVAAELQNEQGEGMLLAPAGILDIGECADSLFFMELPSKHLCSDDCKGLCQGCGKNLNVEKCTCSGKNIDPRLAVLKKLLDKQEN